MHSSVLSSTNQELQNCHRNDSFYKPCPSNSMNSNPMGQIDNGDNQRWSRADMYIAMQLRWLRHNESHLSHMRWNWQIYIITDIWRNPCSGSTCDTCEIEQKPSEVTIFQNRGKNQIGSEHAYHGIFRLPTSKFDIRGRHPTEQL